MNVRGTLYVTNESINIRVTTETFVIDRRSIAIELLNEMGDNDVRL